jgi:putative membrane protein insertion efficiency factor
MARFLVWLIHGYQYLLSPLLGSNCRFAPSCSHYSCQALQKYGALHGTWLSLRRLSRCHPWHAGGHDPLP